MAVKSLVNQALVKETSRYISLRQPLVKALGAMDDPIGIKDRPQAYPVVAFFINEVPSLNTVELIIVQPTLLMLIIGTLRTESGAPHSYSISTAHITSISKLTEEFIDGVYSIAIDTKAGLGITTQNPLNFVSTTENWRIALSSDSQESIKELEHLMISIRNLLRG